MNSAKALKLAVAVAALAATGSAAQAQSKAALWQGTYIGVHLGGEGGKFKNDFGSETVSGVLGGIHAGFNWQSGSIVYGIEGDADLSSAKKNYNFRGGQKAVLSNGFLGSLRGRVGFTSGSALFFGTGGLAFASTKFDLPAGGGTGSLTDTRTGYVVGIGMEYAMSSNVSLRIEGLHYGFDDIFKDDINGGLKFDANVIRAGLSYKF